MGRLTQEQAEQRVREIHENRVVLCAQFVSTSAKHKFRCLECAHTWAAAFNNVTHKKSGCPLCSKKKLYANRMLQKQEVEKRIAAIHGKSLRLLGQYRGTGVKHRFKCYKCLQTWKAVLNSVLNTGCGCPKCAWSANGERLRKSNPFTVKTLTVENTKIRVQGFEGQGIQWLREHRKLKLADLVLDSSGDVPVIPYRIGRRNRNFYPDIYIPKLNRIVEVKSPYTSGLLTGRDWKKNQAKAKATKAAGYKFTLLLMDKKGTRFFLPKGWYDMSREKVLWHMFNNNADFPATSTKARKPRGLKSGTYKEFRS